MGCSASQSVVASSEDNNPEDNKPIREYIWISSSEIEMFYEERAELSYISISTQQSHFNLHLNDDTAPPTSFEIPLELEADSLIKKHPPKRLEERLTKQLSPPQTISELSDKLANAELRRQSVSKE